MKKYRRGYVPGVFDLFHIGHLNLLRRCKEQCDYLIAGVLTDELAAFFKGERPYIPYAERAAIVAAIRYVDEVVPVDDMNTDKMAAWRLYHFDCHFSGDDHGTDWAEVRQALEKVGSAMEFFPYTQGTSSTKLKSLITRELPYGEDCLFTFDVFDTLITRRVATPYGIFALMAKRLQDDPAYADLPVWIRCGFLEQRIKLADRVGRLYCQGESEDCTLAEIYEVVGDALGLGQRDKQRLLSLEVATELENVCAVPVVIQQVTKLLEKERQVAFISDMYLAGTVIRQLIAKVAPKLVRVPLYVSADYRRRKLTRHLYQVVAEGERADFFDWVHTGDNLETDIAAARALGIQTVRFDEAALTAEEKARMEGQEGNVSLQLTIGAHRLSRLRHENIPPLPTAVQAVSCWGLAEHFPTGLVRERVVLYAAGKFGRAVYQKLVATGHQVVLWLDQAPQMAQADGLPVEGPSALQRLAPADWDDLVIAVLHEAAVPVIRETLATLDVDMEQVHWFDMRQYSFCR